MATASWQKVAIRRPSVWRWLDDHPSSAWPIATNVHMISGRAPLRPPRASTRHHYTIQGEAVAQLHEPGGLNCAHAATTGYRDRIHRHAILSTIYHGASRERDGRSDVVSAPSNNKHPEIPTQGCFWIQKSPLCILGDIWKWRGHFFNRVGTHNNQL